MSGFFGKEDQRPADFLKPLRDMFQNGKAAKKERGHTKAVCPPLF